MAEIALTTSETKPSEFRPHRNLAIFTVLFALGTPVLVTLIHPWLDAVFPYPMNRFWGMGVYWIAIAFAIFVSVKIEGIPLSTFGIKKNTRSLRYRLIELIATLITGLVMMIVIILFARTVREFVDVPSAPLFGGQAIPPWWFFIGAWLTGAFAEEFLFRAYAIERLTMLTGKRWLAAVITVLTFSAFHMFGWDWVHFLTTALPGGIMITGIYLWRRSLLVVVIIHGLFNLPLLFLPIIAPYL